LGNGDGFKGIQFPFLGSNFTLKKGSSYLNSSEFSSIEPSLQKRVRIDLDEE
jgi:hypothetical protein